MNFLLIVIVWSVKKKDNCMKIYNLRDESKLEI